MYSQWKHGKFLKNVYVIKVYFQITESLVRKQEGFITQNFYILETLILYFYNVCAYFFSEMFK